VTHERCPGRVQSRQHGNDMYIRCLGVIYGVDLVTIHMNAVVLLSAVLVWLCSGGLTFPVGTVQDNPDKGSFMCCKDCPAEEGPSVDYHLEYTVTYRQGPTPCLLSCGTQSLDPRVLGDGTPGI
jgi:hypothetical protein